MLQRETFDVILAERAFGFADHEGDRCIIADLYKWRCKTVNATP